MWTSRRPDWASFKDALDLLVALFCRWAFAFLLDNNDLLSFTLSLPAASYESVRVVNSSKRHNGALFHKICCHWTFALSSSSTASSCWSSDWPCSIHSLPPIGGCRSLAIVDGAMPSSNRWSAYSMIDLYYCGRLWSWVRFHYDRDSCTREGMTSCFCSSVGLLIDNLVSSSLTSYLRATLLALTIASTLTISVVPGSASCKCCLSII